MARGRGVRLAAGLGAVALAAGVAGCNWVQPRYDAGHTGTNAGETALTAATVAGLGEAWSADGLAAPGAVAVVKGTVVVTEASAVRAYDARTGAPRWSHDYAHGFPPEQWPYGPPHVSAPTVDGDTVRTAVLSVGASAVPTNSISGLDLGTGAPVAGVPATVPLEPTGSTLTDGAGSFWGPLNMFTGTAEGVYIYGVSGVAKADGRTVTALHNSPGATDVAVGSGIAAYGTPGGGLAAIDAAGQQGCTHVTTVDVWQCTPLWSAPIPPVVKTPVIRDGVVYATTGSALYALTLPATPAGGSPQPLWAAAVNDGTAPAVTAAGDAYVGSSTSGIGRLEAYAGADCPYGVNCTPAWAGTTGGNLTQAPTVAGDVAYAVTADEVFAFRAAGCGAATCAPLWSADLPAAPTAPVTVLGGRLFVPTATALVAYALPA